MIKYFKIWRLKSEHRRLAIKLQALALMSSDIPIFAITQGQSIILRMNEIDIELKQLQS